MKKPRKQKRLAKKWLRRNSYKYCYESARVKRVNKNYNSIEIVMRFKHNKNIRYMFLYMG